MDLTGEYSIPATRERVWQALNDPEVLQRCIAGCQEMEKVSDTEFTAKVAAKVGPVRANFTGKVVLSEIDAPNGYVISGEGQGGVAGFAKGGATVKLADDGEGTVLTYEAKAEVGGKLASVGSRLVGGVAKKMADDFFTTFCDIVGEAAAEKMEAAESAAVEAEKAGIPGLVWVIGLIVVVGGLLYFFVN